MPSDQSHQLTFFLYGSLYQWLYRKHQKNVHVCDPALTHHDTINYSVKGKMWIQNDCIQSSSTISQLLGKWDVGEQNTDQLFKGHLVKTLPAKQTAAPPRRFSPSQSAPSLRDCRGEGCMGSNKGERGRKRWGQKGKETGERQTKRGASEGIHDSWTYIFVKILHKCSPFVLVRVLNSIGAIGQTAAVLLVVVHHLYLQYKNQEKVPKAVSNE